MAKNSKLLFVNEYGIYPELIASLRETGCEVTVEHLMRNAIRFIKKQNPSIVVAEFHHEPQFRDRVSNLESMLAQIEGKHVDTRTIVIYDPERKIYLDKMLQVFSVDVALPNPVDPALLAGKVMALCAESGT